MSISKQIGEDHPKEIIATTLVAYALSSILTGTSSIHIPPHYMRSPPPNNNATTNYNHSLSPTGLSFFLLGALKLGVIIGFFPRHILVG
jgi:hypothetical protein